MLNRAKKQELRERLEAIIGHDGYSTIEKELAGIVREILEETPTESEQADAVRRLLDRGEGRSE